MAIVFPASPSTNDTFTAGSITYKWDGAKWIGLGVTPTDRLIEGSNSLEIDGSNNLVWNGGNVGIGTANPLFDLHINSDSNTTLGVYSDQTTGDNYQVASMNLRTYESSSNTASAGDFLLTGKNTVTFGGANRFIMRGQTNVELAFYSNNTERMTIDATGQVQIANGNLKFSTAGTGIDFSSTSNPTFGGSSMSSELLDDYEEGYWFPYISGSTSGTVTSFNERMGTYTKIGNRVIAEFYLSNPGSNSGVSGNWRIDGLPYISSAIPAQGFGTNFYGGGAVHWARSIPTTSYLALSVPQSGGNYSWVIDGKTGNTESGLISGSIASNLLIRGSISYIHN